MVLRRGHLYVGLFLFPWACLYGVTAFLFNHPGAFSDQPPSSFSAADLAGTALAEPLDPADVARAAFTALAERPKFDPQWRLAQQLQATWDRDFAFATVKVGDRQFNVLYDVHTGGGTIRAQRPSSAGPPRQTAPFAVGSAPSRGRGGGAPRAGGERLTIPQSLPERLKSALPVLLAARGHAGAEVSVTSTPSVKFDVMVGDVPWRAGYNLLAGSLEGEPADAPEEPMSLRNFLLRLHTASGYPGKWDAQWFWALIVDAMAAAMVFWGLTGIVMWLQIKAVRKAGCWTLAISALAATWLAFAMHAKMIG
jgi:hypothetical protein